MSKRIRFEVELPNDLAKLRLPKAVEQRLHALLDKQDQRQRLTAAERREAQGLVDLAELLSLLRLRVERVKERTA